MIIKKITAIKNLKIILFTVVAILILLLNNTYNYFADVKFAKKFEKNVLTNNSFLFNEITPFKWDKVCILTKPISEYDTANQSIFDFIVSQNFKFSFFQGVSYYLSSYSIGEEYKVAFIFIESGQIKKIYTIEPVVRAENKELAIKETGAQFGMCSVSSNVFVRSNHKTIEFTE